MVSVHVKHHVYLLTYLPKMLCIATQFTLKSYTIFAATVRVEELCESRGGRAGLSVPMSLTASVDVKQH